jgi:hypothetical protein
MIPDHVFSISFDEGVKVNSSGRETWAANVDGEHERACAACVKGFTAHRRRQKKSPDRK